MYRVSDRTLQTVDSGWKKHNGSTLSCGSGLNWDMVDFSAATTSCGRYRDLAMLGEKLQPLTLIILESQQHSVDLQHAG